jgi:hypothetical protein
MNHANPTRDERSSAARYHIAWNGLWIYDEGIAPAPETKACSPNANRSESRVNRRLR